MKLSKEEKQKIINRLVPPEPIFGWNPDGGWPKFPTINDVDFPKGRFNIHTSVLYGIKSQTPISIKPLTADD